MINEMMKIINKEEGKHNDNGESERVSGGRININERSEVEG
jgi:hypothetical protein